MLPIIKKNLIKILLLIFPIGLIAGIAISLIYHYTYGKGRKNIVKKEISNSVNKQNEIILK